jgi:hypothetical protein
MPGTFTGLQSPLIVVPQMEETRASRLRWVLPLADIEILLGYFAHQDRPQKQQCQQKM